MACVRQLFINAILRRPPWSLSADAQKKTPPETVRAFHSRAVRISCGISRRLGAVSFLSARIYDCVSSAYVLGARQSIAPWGRIGVVRAWNPYRDLHVHGILTSHQRISTCEAKYIPKGVENAFQDVASDVREQFIYEAAKRWVHKY